MAVYVVAAVSLTLASINLRLERNPSTYTDIKSSPSVYESPVVPRV